MNPPKHTKTHTTPLLLLLLLTHTTPLTADETTARAHIQQIGGQIIPIAQNTKALRILIPPKTFEGRVLTDDDLTHLKHIPHIQELDLKNTGITDAGLQHLTTLTHLQRLHLEKTKITDAGTPALKNLTNLQYLNLYATNITDTTLQHLQPLKQLKNLYLWQTQITTQAAKKFHQTQTQNGNNHLEINLGWQNEILSPARLAALKKQRQKIQNQNQNQQPNQPTNTNNPDFTTHILPILQNHCTECHGEQKQKDKLRLDTLTHILNGSKHGPVITPGDLIESTLYQRITLPPDDPDIMPPENDPLTKTQITLIKNWIANGAKPKTDTPPATDPPTDPPTEPPTDDPPQNPQPTDNNQTQKPSPIYTEYITPILQNHCTECHGTEKQKAGLRLDTLTHIHKGSKHQPILKNNNPDQSPLYQRITLPPNHDDIMPPKGDPLTQAQTQIIKLWILNGAQ